MENVTFTIGGLGPFAGALVAPQGSLQIYMLHFANLRATPADINAHSEVAVHKEGHPDTIYKIVGVNSFGSSDNLYASGKIEMQTA